MIGRIRGTLIEKNPPWLLVEAGGVGYELEAPMTVFYDLPTEGDTVCLYTHFVVRDDAQLLFAFVGRYERELFRTLIRVNGVGPKMALGILSGIEAERLLRCVADQDVTALTKVPGVGRKTAERLLVELRDRLEKIEGGPAVAMGSPATGREPDAGEDAVAALEALGYRNREARQAVSVAAEQGGLTSEELIRQALKTLAR